MRVVVALGGNALLHRGQEPWTENQRESVREACAALAPVAAEHELVISHGNGPQSGSYRGAESYSLDMLDAQIDGMIGYMIEQELGNELPAQRHLATLLTMIEVDPDDPAFQRPTRPIGPVYTAEEASRLEAERGWTFRPDGDAMRRVVPSPLPRRIFGVGAIELLLDAGFVVICAGGGGIPTAFRVEPAPAGRRLAGVEAVIDKDMASALLAADIHADALIIATDVDGVYRDWGTPQQQLIRRATPAQLSATGFPAGTMGPKVQAAAAFVEQTGGFAAIGTLAAVQELLARSAGTIVYPDPAAVMRPRELSTGPSWN